MNEARPPHPTPEQLREEQRLRDERSDARYRKYLRERVRYAALIGLFVPLTLSVLAQLSVSLSMIPVVLCGIVWSVVVQVKAINHLISTVVYGLGMIVLLAVIDGKAELSWWLGLTVAGALIGIINDIYRDRSRGI